MNDELVLQAIDGLGPDKNFIEAYKLIDEKKVEVKDRLIEADILDKYNRRREMYETYIYEHTKFPNIVNVSNDLSLKVDESEYGEIYNKFYALREELIEFLMGCPVVDRHLEDMESLREEMDFAANFVYVMNEQEKTGEAKTPWYKKCVGWFKRLFNKKTQD